MVQTTPCAKGTRIRNIPKTIPSVALSGHTTNPVIVPTQQPLKTNAASLELVPLSADNTAFTRATSVLSTPLTSSTGVAQSTNTNNQGDFIMANTTFSASFSFVLSFNSAAPAAELILGVATNPTASIIVGAGNPNPTAEIILAGEVANAAATIIVPFCSQLSPIALGRLVAAKNYLKGLEAPKSDILVLGSADPNPAAQILVGVAPNPDAQLILGTASPNPDAELVLGAEPNPTASIVVPFKHTGMTKRAAMRASMARKAALPKCGTYCPIGFARPFIHPTPPRRKNMTRKQRKAAARAAMAVSSRRINQGLARAARKRRQAKNSIPSADRANARSAKFNLPSVGDINWAAPAQTYEQPSAQIEYRRLSDGEGELHAPVVTRTMRVARAKRALVASGNLPITRTMREEKLSAVREQLVEAGTMPVPQPQKLLARLQDELKDARAAHRSSGSKAANHRIQSLKERIRSLRAKGVELPSKKTKGVHVPSLVKPTTWEVVGVDKKEKGGVSIAPLAPIPPAPKAKRKAPAMVRGQKATPAVISATPADDLDDRLVSLKLQLEQLDSPVVSTGAVPSAYTQKAQELVNSYKAEATAKGVDDMTMMMRDESFAPPAKATNCSSPNRKVADLINKLPKFVMNRKLSIPGGVKPIFFFNHEPRVAVETEVGIFAVNVMMKDGRFVPCNINVPSIGFDAAFSSYGTDDLHPRLAGNNVMSGAASSTGLPYESSPLTFLVANYCVNGSKGMYIPASHVSINLKEQTANQQIILDLPGAQFCTEKGGIPGCVEEARQELRSAVQEGRTATIESFDKNLNEVTAKVTFKGEGLNEALADGRRHTLLIVATFHHDDTKFETRGGKQYRFYAHTAAVMLVEDMDAVFGGDGIFKFNPYEMLGVETPVKAEPVPAAAIAPSSRVSTTAREDAVAKGERTFKVISGGQSGVDLAGLVAAKQAGIPTGGTAPKGFRAFTNEGVDSVNPELGTVYGLVEDSRRDFESRTVKNIQDSDGTVLFGDVNSPGSKMTKTTATRLRKPLIVNPSVNQLVAWIKENNISVLNVAGNREHKNPGIHDRVVAHLTSTFNKLNEEGEPTVSPIVERSVPAAKVIHRDDEAETWDDSYPELDNYEDALVEASTERVAPAREAAPVVVPAVRKVAPVVPTASPMSTAVETANLAAELKELYKHINLSYRPLVDGQTVEEVKKNKRKLSVNNSSRRAAALATLDYILSRTQGSAVQVYEWTVADIKAACEVFSAVMDKVDYPMVFSYEDTDAGFTMHFENAQSITIGNDGRAYDNRGRAFEQVIEVLGHFDIVKTFRVINGSKVPVQKKVPVIKDVAVASSTGKFMQAFCGFLLMYAHNINKCRGGLGENFNEMLTKGQDLFPMSEGNVVEQSGGFLHGIQSSLKLSIHKPFPGAHTELKPEQTKDLGRNIAAALRGEGDDNTLECNPEVEKAAMEFAMTKYPAIGFHFAKGVFMNGITHSSMALVQEHAPTLFTKLLLATGLDAQAAAQSVISLTLKASKGAKRATLSLARAVDVIGQVEAGWQFYNQAKPLEGWLVQECMAPTFVLPPGMAMFLGKEDEKPTAHFKKTERLIFPLYRGSDLATAVTLKGQSEFEVCLAGAESVLSVEGRTYRLGFSNKPELRFGTQIAFVPKEEGKGVWGVIEFKQHDVANLAEVRWTVKTGVDGKKTELAGEYDYFLTHHNPKLRGVIKAMMGGADRRVLYNQFNNSLLKGLGLNDIKLVAPQDTIKSDMLYSWLMVIGNTIRYNDPRNPAIAHLISMKNAIHAAMGVTSEALVIEQTMVAAGYYNEMLSYFEENFGQALWMKMTDCGEQGRLMFNLYSGRAANGEGWTVVPQDKWGAKELEVATNNAAAGFKTVMFAESVDYATNSKQNGLLFVLDKAGSVVEYYHRSYCFVGAKDAPVYGVELFESSTVGEAISDSRHMTPSVRSLYRMDGDIAKAKALLDAGKNQMFMSLVIAGMASGDNFGCDRSIEFQMETVEKVKANSDKFNEDVVSLAKDDIAELMALLEQNGVYNFHYTSDLFKNVAYALRNVVFNVRGKKLWTPALYAISKLKSEESSNNLAQQFFRDILVECLEGRTVSSLELRRVSGILDSLCDSKSTKQLVSAADNVAAKRIALPCIPAGEMWVLKSNHPGSVYQKMKRDGFDMDRAQAGDVTIFVHAVRAPLTDGPVQKLVVITKAENDANFWKVNADTFAQGSMGNGMDFGDFDGDGIYALQLEGRFMMSTFNSVRAFVSNAMGYDMFNTYANKENTKDGGLNESYAADHYGIKPWKKVAVTLSGLPAQLKSKKVVMPMSDYITFNQKAREIQSKAVGIAYNVFMWSEHLVDILLAAKSVGLALPKGLDAAANGDLVAPIGQMYEVILGGFSDASWTVYDRYIRDMKDGFKTIHASGEKANLDQFNDDLVAMGVAGDKKEGFKVLTYAAYQLFFLEKFGAFNDCDTPDGSRRELPLLLKQVMATALVSFELLRGKFEGFNGVLSSRSPKSQGHAVAMELCRQFLADHPEMVKESLVCYQLQQVIDEASHLLAGHPVNERDLPSTNLSATQLQHFIDKVAPVDVVKAVEVKVAASVVTEPEIDEDYKALAEAEAKMEDSIDAEIEPEEEEERPVAVELEIKPKAVVKPVVATTLPPAPWKNATTEELNDLVSMFEESVVEAPAFVKPILKAKEHNKEVVGTAVKERPVFVRDEIVRQEIINEVAALPATRLEEILSYVRGLKAKMTAPTVPALSPMEEVEAVVEAEVIEPIAEEEERPQAVEMELVIKPKKDDEGGSPAPVVPSAPKPSDDGGAAAPSPVEKASFRRDESYAPASTPHSDEQFVAQAKVLPVLEEWLPAVVAGLEPWTANKIAELLSGLNIEQQNAVRLVLSGGNYVLTGDAGTGKSYTSSVAVEVLELLGYKIVPVATTGLASMNLKNSQGTINRAAGVGQGFTSKDDKKTMKEAIDLIKRMTRNDKVKKRFAEEGYKGVILLIDEISMMDTCLGYVINEALQIVQRDEKAMNRARRRPIQVLGVGDFKQLEPVGGQMIFKPAVFDGVAKASFMECLDMQLINLQQQMRQAGDPEFGRQLNLLATGQGGSNLKNVPIIRERFKASLDAMPEGALHVFALNDELNAFNNEKLNELKGQGNSSKVYNAYVEAIDCTKEELLKFVQPIPERLELVVGAPVRVKQNIADPANPNKFLAANGSRGIVVALNSNSIDVELKDGSIVEIEKVNVHTPKNEKGDPIGVFYQIPVCLAWGTTYHGCQGITEDEIVLHVYTRKGGKATGQMVPMFNNNAFYVGNSRVKTAAGLFFYTGQDQVDLAGESEEERQERAKHFWYLFSNSYRTNMEVIKWLNEQAV